MSWLKPSFLGIALSIIALNVYSQALDSTRIVKMTREEILSLSQDDLLEMSMENLVFLANKMGISIDELLNMKTNIASKTTLTPRETPGIVSFITEEEIKLSGARDLIDVLKLIPGFDFGYDVSGVVGVGLRGNWVHEGKILMMVDGLPLNELSYYNLEFGNHYPVDQIKRIEIIRGPGSATYGGNAELGVINIITKSGRDIKGAEISGTYGQMQKTFGRSNLNINSGFLKNNWDVKANAFIAKAQRTDQVFTEYIDNVENTIDLSNEKSDIKTSQFNVSASNEKLSFRMFYDDYKTDYYYYDSDLEENIRSVDEFRTILGELKYNFKINEKLNIQPKINYRYNRPYYEKDYWRNTDYSEYQGSLLLNYSPDKKFNLITGFDYINDKARCVEDTGYFYSTLEQSMDLLNLAFYGEGTYKLSKINIIAGFRVEHSDHYGWASAPRIGFTGIFNKFHFKALFSGAFRTPAIGNIDVAAKIGPEKSFVSEIELGYRINDNMLFTANFFDIQIKKSIVYFDTGAAARPIYDWGYVNAESAGSDGFELEFKTIYGKLNGTFNYSFYTQALRSLTKTYNVPGHPNSALGFSQHKLCFNVSYKPNNKIAISPSFIYNGKKYGYTYVDDDGDPMIGSLGPFYQLNLSFNYKIYKGIESNISVYDIFNQKPPFAHPYEGWYAPYPGRSREILIKLILSTDIFGN